MTTSAAVDTSLSTFDALTLMTKAFELTHLMHGERTDHSDLREQRDAITREMQRRSDGMERALVAVETAERVMRFADQSLTNSKAQSDHERVAMARTALDMGMERTTTVTCTLVKDQTISDRISAAAREDVAPITKHAREVGESTRAYVAGTHL